MVSRILADEPVDLEPLAPYRDKLAILSGFDVKLDEAGVNVRIVAVISPQLFALEDPSYRNSIASTAERWDAMCITNRSLRTMREWLANPVVGEYSMRLAIRRIVTPS